MAWKYINIPWFTVASCFQGNKQKRCNNLCWHQPQLLSVSCNGFHRVQGWVFCIINIPLKVCGIFGVEIRGE